jgi:hypothetical protein
MPTRRGSDRTDKTDTALALIEGVMHKAVTIDGAPVPYYEQAAESSKPPFYTSGPADMEPGDVQTGGAYGGAQSVEIQLDSWSDYNGKREVGKLNERALDVLAGASLSLTGEDRLIRYRVLNTRIQGEPEDSKMTYHGIIILSFRIQLPTLP